MGQSYLRGNLWRDWGAEADAVYSGTDIAPLASQVTRLELGGGLTGRINANISVFANVDYEFAVGAAENEKRNGVRGAFGARYVVTLRFRTSFGGRDSRQAGRALSIPPP